MLRALDVTAASRQVTITGRGFGATRGTGAVTLTQLGNGPTPPANPISSYVSWSDTSITVRLASMSVGRYRLSVTPANGQAATNGVAILQRGVGLGLTANDPVILEVNRPAGQPTLGLNFTTGANLENDHALQNAVNAATALNRTLGVQTMVLAWPAPQRTDNPPVTTTRTSSCTHQVDLQGVGPGGFQANGTFVPRLAPQRSRLQPRQRPRRGLGRPA